MPAKDSEAVAVALTELLSNPAVLQRWKCLAKQNLERFSATRVTQKTLAVYQELIPKL